MEAAGRHLTQALALDPGHPVLCIEAANLRGRLGRPQDALNMLHRAREGNRFSTVQEEASCFRSQAVQLVELGALDEADEMLRRSLLLEPDSELASSELDYISWVRDVAGLYGYDPLRVIYQFKGTLAQMSRQGGQEWNPHVVDLGRSLNALTEEEIENGRTSLPAAAMNHVKVKLAAGRFVVWHMAELGIDARAADLLSLCLLAPDSMPENESAMKVRAIHRRECANRCNAGAQGVAPAFIGVRHRSPFINGQGRFMSPREAAPRIRMAAEQGNATAQLDYGMLCAAGEGVPKDPAQAVLWFLMAAQQGAELAQYILWKFYSDGEGVPKDSAEAIRWLRMAAEQGNAAAQHNTALLYYEGKGVRRDYPEAFRSWLRAAEQGHAPAQYNLACLYHEGNGVGKDSTEAGKWCRIAAEQGYKPAQETLGLR